MGHVGHVRRRNVPFDVHVLSHGTLGTSHGTGWTSNGTVGRPCDTWAVPLDARAGRWNSHHVYTNLEETQLLTTDSRVRPDYLHLTCH